MTAELGIPGRPVDLINKGVLTEVHVGGVRSPSPLRRLRAIVDTGAQLGYYIDIETAKEIGLREIEGIRVPTSSAAGLEEAPVYLAQLRIPALDVAARAVPVYSLDIRRMGVTFNFILGREFLRGFTMIYDGPTGGVTVEAARSPGRTR